MGRRFTAFLTAASGGAIELFGALAGQGVLGSGALFGLLGPGSRTEATMLGFVLGTVTIVAAVAVMFARDARRLAAVIAIAAVIGTLAAGTIFGLGALLAIVGAILAARIDRNAPLV